jgi:hypothetical protein
LELQRDSGINNFGNTDGTDLTDGNGSHRCATRGLCAWRAVFLWLATEVTEALYTLPLSINNRLSLLPRSDAGNEFCRLRLIRSHPFDPYLRDVRASPSGCCRFGQARLTQASTTLEIRIERIERMRKRIDFRARRRAGAPGQRDFFWLATEAAAGTRSSADFS